MRLSERIKSLFEAAPVEGPVPIDGAIELITFGGQQTRELTFVEWLFINSLYYLLIITRRTDPLFRFV